MKKQIRLTKDITEEEFDNGYWYADEIRSFAKRLGIANSSRLRKDELERLIKHFFRTGKVKSSNRKNIVKVGVKDVDIGLKTSLPIKHYTSNKQTKTFITSEAQKIAPDLPTKSGVWYRLNRWRDEKITKGRRITYGDLIDQFVKLSRSRLKFEKISVGRYINFLSDYLANEQGATREQAIKSWKELKKLDMPKDYRSWRAFAKK